MNPINDLFRRRESANPVSSPAVKLLFAGAGLLLLYVLAATGGYIWIRHVLKNEAIGFSDVALLRWKEVRRGVGAQQFAKARADWQAKNYQPAYLAFASGLRNDPENVEGQLAAAKFLLEMGSVPMALKVLEDGFARNPRHRDLSARLFELLLASGRDRRALELLRRAGSAGLAGEHAVALRTHELQATLNADGAAAARQLLERHPELEKTPASLPVVALVLWETKDRLKAVGLLEGHVRSADAAYAAHARLVEWHLALSMTAEAQAVAELAGQRFPSDLAPRTLLIEAVAARSFRGREWVEAIEAYLRDFSGRPQAITQLALLAGRKGWLDLARGLYDLAAVRQHDLRLPALAYGDALVVAGKRKEAQEILAQLEAQVAEGPALFMQQVRQRQVLLAASQGDSANVREFARRMAASLRGDPHQLEAARRQFERKGIAEAVAEFSRRSGAADAGGRPGAGRPGP
jgi:hypothetical protein